MIFFLVRLLFLLLLVDATCHFRFATLRVEIIVASKLPGNSFVVCSVSMNIAFIIFILSSLFLIRTLWSVGST